SFKDFVSERYSQASMRNRIRSAEKCAAPFLLNEGRKSDFYPLFQRDNGELKAAFSTTVKALGILSFGVQVMRSKSPSTLLAQLKEGTRLEGPELFQALSLAAVNGANRPEESSLSPQQRTLLDVRRDIRADRLDGAREKLALLELSSRRLEGDRQQL